ncbi:MAG TPA: helix-hairpin-helix domain-containing protein [Candidatus Stackebrandtia excrementipullorum]|nr:helix-hairpin-helix domain-containing protein [Candidatus Stackebrandtia excrementipullorum]
MASVMSKIRIDQRTRSIVAVLLVVVGVSALLAAWFAWPRAEPASLAVAVSQTSEADPVTAPITVTVAGDVAAPGLVELPAGSRVADAVEAAGGVLPESASAGYLNLARKLGDGELIVVDAQNEDDGEDSSGDEEPTDADSDAADQPGGGEGPINLNQATVDHLTTLPGVGPVTAQNILDHRETTGGFDSIDQLQEVNGIGPATFAKLADLVTV